MVQSGSAQVRAPQNYICDTWSPVHELQQAVNRDPNTNQPLYAMATTSEADIERALRHADEVHRSGATRGIAPRERAELLNRIADQIEARAEELAVADAINSGIPISITRQLVSFLPGRFRAAAADLTKIVRDTPLAAGGRMVRLLKLPWGPAAVLTPWNAPSFIAGSKVASALAAGCPVLLKPSEWAPNSAQVLAKAIVAAGLPFGAFQLLHGAGEVGKVLTADNRIKVISFTGGQIAGRHIAHAAAENFTVLQLELGGNNPVIVLPDADVERAGASIATGLCKLNGQWCEGPGKILAPVNLVGPLTEVLLDRLGKVQIGHSLEESTELGPISHAGHHATLHTRIEALRARGATIHQPGKLPELDGCFLSPTIAVGSDARAAREELFGPVISLHGVVSVAEAIAIANTDPSGLDAYVYGEDLDTAMRVGSQVVAGEVRINGAHLTDLGDCSAQSFWGPAGIGGHGPAESVRVFCGDRVVGVDDPNLPI